jgi:hypothetical protein
MRNMIMSFAKKFIGKEVKKMKSLLSIVIAITMVISTSGLSFAAFQSLGKQQYSANSGTVGGTPSVTVPFSVFLRNISNDTTATAITWSTITAGTTGWKAANQYIAVKGWTTYSDWGIQIYTNNTNYTGTGSPAGLINTANTLYSLPMAWRTTTETVLANNPKLGIVEHIVGGYNVLADGTTPPIEYYPWFYMIDKQQDIDPATAGHQSFGDYQAYATFIGSAGYQHAPTDYATPWATDTTYYVYLGANFTMAAPGATYSTNSLTVEMYRL